MRTSGAAERTSASTCWSNFTKLSWNMRTSLRAVRRTSSACRRQNVSFRTDPYFGVSVPTSVPGIEPSILYRMKIWKDKKARDGSIVM